MRISIPLMVKFSICADRILHDHNWVSDGGHCPLCRENIIYNPHVNGTLYYYDDDIIEKLDEPTGILEFTVCYLNFMHNDCQAATNDVQKLPYSKLILFSMGTEVVGVAVVHFVVKILYTIMM